MDKNIRMILGLWILSHVGHAVLSIFYERPPASLIVPIIYFGFVLLAVGVWRRNPWAAAMSMIVAIITIVIQAFFIWGRDAYGALSAYVLIFDVMGILACLLYLLFFFSPNRDTYFRKA